MAQNPAIHETSRIKLMLVSLAIIMIGITFAVLPVSATTTDSNVQNLVVTSSSEVTLGPAQNGYVVNAQLTAVGTYRLTIRDTDASGNEYTLFTTYVANAPFSMPPLTVTIPGTIQVLVSPQGGSSATLDASLQHSTTTYPLQLPGLALLVAGAAIILTRVYRVRVSVSPSMPVQ
jgi:hypothetical protein